MANVIAIFGTLIALNLGFGYWLSGGSESDTPESGVVEVEEVSAADASAPSTAAQPAVEDASSQTAQ